MLTKERKTTQQLPARTGATAETLSRQQIIDPPPVFEILQLVSNLTPDEPAPPTGTVAVNQGQDPAFFYTGLLKFTG